MKKVLLIGYGNPGRLDDGLGPSLVSMMETINIPNLTLDSDYQLTVEDAVDISEHDIVIFADAATKGSEPYYFKRIYGEPHVSFSSHTISPNALLGLAEEVYGKSVDGYILGIRGYDFNEFGEKISDRASKNLKEAFIFITETIKKQRFTDIGTDI